MRRKPAPSSDAGAPPQRPVERGAEGAAREVGEPPDRGHQADLGEVERARDQGDRGDLAAAIGDGEEAHDPAQAPADHLRAVGVGVGEDDAGLVAPRPEPENATRAAAGP